MTYYLTMKQKHTEKRKWTEQTQQFPIISHKKILTAECCSYTASNYIPYNPKYIIVLERLSNCGSLLW